jgi:protein-S-isoprenylcysteine O-methyltransferase Ste14
MKRIVSIPPNYFYGCVIFCLPFYFVLKGFCFLDFPFCLAGLLLLPPGLYLVFIAWNQFRKHDTPEDFSESKALVTKGIYRYSRNPMYLGGAIFLLGLSFSTGNLLALTAPLVFFLVMHFMFIPFEEDKMKLRFENDYTRYKNSVRRWI